MAWRSQGPIPTPDLLAQVWGQGGPVVLAHELELQPGQHGAWIGFEQDASDNEFCLVVASTFSATLPSAVVSCLDDASYSITGAAASISDSKESITVAVFPPEMVGAQPHLVGGDLDVSQLEVIAETESYLMVRHPLVEARGPVLFRIECESCNASMSL